MFVSDKCLDVERILLQNLVCFYRYLSKSSRLAPISFGPRTVPVRSVLQVGALRTGTVRGPLRLRLCRATRKYCCATNRVMHR